MTRQLTSFVLAYHGFSAEVGKRIVMGEPMDASDHAYDWLGPGIYFWESDPKRAWEWADWKVSRGDFKEAFVVGAAIDLGNCLNLMERESAEILKDAYFSLLSTIQGAGGDENEIPTNQKGGSIDEDYKLRFRDCAVIKHLHTAYEEEKKVKFDTVRGLFLEGEELYPGSGFKEQTHIQIAVRTKESIKGKFLAERP